MESTHEITSWNFNNKVPPEGTNLYTKDLKNLYRILCETVKEINIDPDSLSVVLGARCFRLYPSLTSWGLVYHFAIPELVGEGYIHVTITIQNQGVVESPIYVFEIHASIDPLFSSLRTTTPAGLHVGLENVLKRSLSFS